MVVQRCADRGISIYRLNSEDYPVVVGVEVDPVNPETATLIPEGGEPVAVGAARGIWLRRPQWPVISSSVSEEGDRRLAVQESVAALGGLWRLLEERCVSAPDALQRARWKLPQLRLAASLGFLVPETIVTTAAETAVKFLDRGEAVLKAVQELSVRRDGIVWSGYVQPALPVDVEGTAAAPLLLQRRLAKVADWRVTVVGAVVHAARTPCLEGGPLDVREAEGVSTSYEVRLLPTKISEACISYVRQAGLRFGAFDLAEDASGGIWFLECNANGQWGWIEAATGMPITDAIVTELIQSPGV
jgi:hypothetical protein